MRLVLSTSKYACYLNAGELLWMYQKFSDQLNTFSTFSDHLQQLSGMTTRKNVRTI